MSESKKDLGYQIERLLQYGVYKQLITVEDVLVVRNTLLAYFNVPEPYTGDVPKETLPFPTPILEIMMDLTAVPSGTLRELEVAKITGFLTPRAGEVNREFWRLYKESPQAATDYFYKLSIDSYYIQKEMTDKNQYWQADSDVGKLEITINVSKPEKDPKDIAAARLLPPSGYPKCVLCIENAGYAGRLNHPARQNHRIVPLDILGKKWYLQYSPYLYYQEHCIVLIEDHTPMRITDLSFPRLLDFVTQFPHYFLGSNADLPIVGGSILAHDHFQGGHHHFPIEFAKTYASFTHPKAPHTTALILDWPLSTVRLRSVDKAELIAAANALKDAWKGYSDATIDVIAYTEPKADAGAEAKRIPHNTITPIARRAGEAFEVDVLFRNNRTSEKYPDGIFHSHPELQHIKKENIGLPEAMGLAILPSRLKDECAAISQYLQGEKTYAPNTDPLLRLHEAWVQDLLGRHGTKNAREKADAIMKQEVGIKFAQVIDCAGVFKRTEAGRAAFVRFLEQTCGYVKSS